MRTYGEKNNILCFKTMSILSCCSATLRFDIFSVPRYYIILLYRHTRKSSKMFIAKKKQTLECIINIVLTEYKIIITKMRYYVVYLYRIFH